MNFQSETEKKMSIIKKNVIYVYRLTPFPSKLAPSVSLWYTCMRFLVPSSLSYLRYKEAKFCTLRGALPLYQILLIQSLWVCCTGLKGPNSEYSCIRIPSTFSSGLRIWSEYLGFAERLLEVFC
jgi:hypothetical protein